MSLDEAVKKYIDVFGGIPLELLMGMSDEDKLNLLENAIKSGKEIEADDEDEII